MRDLGDLSEDKINIVVKFALESVEKVFDVLDIQRPCIMVVIGSAKASRIVDNMGPSRPAGELSKWLRGVADEVDRQEYESHG